MPSRKQSRKRRKAQARRRPPSEAPVAPAPLPREKAGRTVSGDDRPPPIWGNIPVTQVAVLGGLFLLVFGMIKQDPKLVIPGLALGSVGGLELSIREHLTGYRSHTTLLAGVVFVAVVALTFLAIKLILWQCLAIGLVVALPVWWALRKLFEHKSGGLSYRIK